MKTLYLVRHAKSSWEFEDLSDHDRPLNKRGRKDAPLIGHELARREVEPQLIVSSPAVRAITTATLIAKELDYDVERIAIDERIYGADKHELLEVIREAPVEIDELMLVGHNFSITELANILSPEPIADMPTAAVVCLAFDCESWREISKDNATFRFYDFPSNYK